MQEEKKSKQINTSIIKAKDYWHMLGPGLTTGAADDDPSGIVTYTQAGASAYFGFLWTAILTFPLMASVQEMCARIGVVTGRGLAGAIRKHYSKRVLIFITVLLFIANTFNIGADLAIMGQVGQLLKPQIPSFVFILLFSIVSLYLQIYTSYKDYAKYLKWLALVLLTYVASAFSIPVNWGQALTSIIHPHVIIDKNFFFLFSAIIGTTISPYLFFWQTSQEVEEQILLGKTSIKEREAVTTREDISSMRVDVWTGMFISNIIIFFIILASAVTLYGSHVGQTLTAVDAAQALKPVAGHTAYLLFSLGIIGTGMLAIPVLAGSSSYAIAESFGWREGLYRKFKQAHAFYGVIIASVILGLIISEFAENPVKTLLYSAVVNGIISPFIMIFIVNLSSDKKIMGTWVNKKSTTLLGYIIVLLLILVSIAGIFSLF